MSAQVRSPLRRRSRRRPPTARESAAKRFVAGVALALAAGMAAVSAQAGNVARGQQLYESRCVACHSIDANRVGPAHRGVVGRKAGSVPDYDYSSAVKNSRIVWTAATLDLWLADPEKTIPGQKMGYSVPEPGDRADLIAWLAANPAP